MPTANKPRGTIEGLKELRARLRPKILAWAVLAGVAGNLVLFGFLLIFSELPNKEQVCTVILIAGILLLVLTIRAIRIHNIRLAWRARELGYEVKRSQSGRHFVRRVRSKEEEETEFLHAVGANLFCRACCTRIDEQDSAAFCPSCNMVYHTVCMNEPGQCPFCAAGEEVAPEIQEYCKLQDRVNLPALISRLSAHAKRESPVALEKKSLYGRLLDIKTLRRDKREGPSPADCAAHGWPINGQQQRGLGCCISYYLWIPAALGSLLGWYDLATLIIIAVLSYLAYLLLAAIGDWIRGKMWPLKEPSPARRKLIAMRTWLLGTAWTLYLITLIGFALESQLSPWAYQQVVYLGLLCGIAVVAALALGAVSLVVE